MTSAEERSVRIVLACLQAERENLRQLGLSHGQAYGSWIDLADVIENHLKVGDEVAG